MNPPVPASWIEPIRAGLPAYDPYHADEGDRGRGGVLPPPSADTTRAAPDAVVRGHGPLASTIVDPHDLAAGFGDESPLGRLYALGAKVALLGVGHSNNTSLHLAEHRAEWPGKATTREGSPMLVDGRREWVTYDDLDRDEGDFPAIGEAFAATGQTTTATVGVGSAQQCSMPALIDFAVDWMDAHRGR